jgi:hypothetical protein
METKTFVVRSGDLFLGRNGLGSLEKASHKRTHDDAVQFISMFKLCCSGAKNLDFTVWARGRESLNEAK